MTRSMTRWTLAGLIALAAPGAVAVLDAGSTTAEAAPSVSPFAGSWSGTWADVVESERVGTLDWTISDAGRITGTVTSSMGSRSGTLVGHVGADGNLVLIRYVPNDEPSSMYNGFPFQGTVVIEGDGKLVASVTGTPSGAPSFVAILERN